MSDREKLRYSIGQDEGRAGAGRVATYHRVVADLHEEVGLFFALPMLLPEPFTTTKGGSTYSGSVGAAFAPITGFVLVTAGTVVLSVIIVRRLRVVADEKTADVVSTTSFLTTLYKVSETMGQTGFRANRTIRGPIPLLPDIQTRIARLKKKSAEL